MARFHVHVTVAELTPSIDYYSTLFGADPVTIRDDYAKWLLDDPALNFAISTRGAQPGLDHLGIQSEDDAGLAAMEARLREARIAGEAQKGATCCYARSDKYWTVDPQGIAWEAFHTLDSAPTFHEEEGPGEASACCAPTVSSGCC